MDVRDEFVQRTREGFSVLTPWAVVRLSSHEVRSMLQGSQLIKGATVIEREGENVSIRDSRAGRPAGNLGATQLPVTLFQLPRPGSPSQK